MSRTLPLVSWPCWRALLLGCLVGVNLACAALADAPRVAFKVPAGDATLSLKLFTEQSGHEIVYPPEEVRGVRTNAVEGNYTVRTAIDILLAGTSLVVLESNTGALAVNRVKSPNVERAAPTTHSDRPRVMDNPVAGGSRTGVVSGQVRNAATSSFLEGARVVGRNTNVTTSTDRQGNFRLILPAGLTELEVSYTGLETQIVHIDVAAGQTITRDVALTSGIYMLEAVSVEGAREGNARAVTLQREASNLKNIAATDTFGNLANGNVGEFLMRLPGVMAEFNGSEVNSVSIRGLGSDLNSVMMDGDRVATSQSAGVGRRFEFEQASLNLIESVEVTKAPTPDMDGDSIGGNVNMVTKSAFDRADPKYFNYAVGFSYRWGRRSPSDSWTKEPIKGLGPSLNFTYSNVVGEKRNIGILLTGTWHVQGSPGIRSIFDYERTLNRPAYVYSATVPEVIGNPRSRLSAGVKIDYKLSANTVFTLNTFYNWMHDSVFTQKRQLSTSQSIATFDANGTRTGTGTIRPGYTDEFTEVLPASASLSTLTVTTQDKTGRTYQIKPSARHRLDNGRLLIDYNASFSTSHTKYDMSPFDRDYDDQPKGTVVATLRNIGWTIDRSPNREFPDIRQTTGPDITNLANYSGLQITQGDRRGDDTVIGTRFNLKQKLEAPLPWFVKTGFSYRRQEREIQNASRRYNYTGATNIGRFVDTSGRYTEVVRDYRKKVTEYVPSPFPDAFMVAQDVVDHPGDWSEDLVYHYTQYFQNARSMTEQVTGAYVMAEARLRRLVLLSGLRTEETRAAGEGPLHFLSAEERAGRASYVGAITPEEAKRRVTAEYAERTENRARYRNNLPSFHAKYELLGGLIARASYTEGVGRPSFGSIMPNSDVNETAQTVTLSNPGLKPQQSQNYDVSVEYYFEPVGLFSVGAFKKEITNYIYQDTSQRVGDGPDNGFDGDYAGYTIITSANGGFATYRGLEFSYQQQFTFLPGVLKGLGLNANYTYLKTEGNYGGSTVTRALGGFVPRIFNLALNYRDKRISVVLQRNWTSKYLVTNTTNPALVRYQSAREVYDLKTAFRLSRGLSLFCDVENVLNEALVRDYFTYEDRPNTTRLTVPKVVAGIQGRF